MSSRKSHAILGISNPMQGLTPQTRRENEIIAIRVRKCGSRFRHVNQYLEGQASRDHDGSTRPTARFVSFRYEADERCSDWFAGEVLTNRRPFSGV
jgi:hypothetical protein